METKHRTNGDDTHLHAAHHRMRCEEIRSALFEYMTRELGDGRASLVREHLRRCPDCTKAAEQVQATLALFQGAAAMTRRDGLHLTEERRSRVRWVFAHPLCDWIVRHHIAVSIIIAALVLCAVLLWLRLEGLRVRPDPITDGVRITVRTSLDGETSAVVGSTPGGVNAPEDDRAEQP